MLRLAIIGAGWAGARQAEAVAELGGEVVVHWLIDSDEAHLLEQARELGITRTHTDYREALADPAVDAVSVCLPHALHCPVAVEAAEAGKHVLCEKPLAMSVDEGREMLRAAYANGVRLYVAESAVYAPLPRMLRQLVATGEHLGEMAAAVCVKGFRGLDYGYPGRRSWLSDPERGGSGTWLLHGIHTVAQIRYIFGEVESVFVREHKTEAFLRSDLEGTMSLLLRLANGCAVHLVQTAESKARGHAGGYTVYGTEAVLRAYDDRIEVLSDDPSAAQVLACPTQSLSSFAEEIRAFAAFVETGTPGPTTGEGELRSLAVVEAGYESMRSGMPVELPERYPDLWAD
ncbi:MAG: Gfo/Idh/MocA family oxidoreductase [Armatimonadota bacterium]|jgi:predicted dehydrogenase